MAKFDDSRYMVPAGLLDYFSLVRVPDMLRIPEPHRQKWYGELKAIPADFVVTEPVPTYPGLADLYKANVNVPQHRMLTVSDQSDMPGLRTDQDLKVRYKGCMVSAVALTVVKKGETTWGVADLLAQFLSEQLGRPIDQKRIVYSGLKDRTAVTAQTFVVIGVSMSEMSRVDWSKLVMGDRGFFVKDLRPADRLLDQGDHLANNFEIKVRLEGKSAQEIEEYLGPRVEILRHLRYWIPNAFHLQRLGPTQDNQKWGRNLLTGDFQPPAGVNPFTTHAEAMLFQMLFGASTRGSQALRDLRKELMPYWQYNFPEMERLLRRKTKRFNLKLEYEVVKRLSNPKFRGSSELVLYDLQNRLSIAVGAWRAVYWNWALGSLIESGDIEPGGKARIPLAFSCDESREFYRQWDYGHECLSEMAVTEQLAARAEPYMHAFIEKYWTDIAAEQAASGLASPSDHPDQTGLSTKLIQKLFPAREAVGGFEPPARRDLSAALVRHLFLVPREFKTGNPKPYAPTRDAFVRVGNFDYHCEDGAAVLRFSLRSGSYATMLIGLLFDTSDPEELNPTATETETAGAVESE
jgi:tRNA(Glu) U13 pseudouridine synthase TruD